MSLSLLEELMLLPWQSLLKCLFFHADQTTGCLYSPTNPVLSVLLTGQEDRRIKKTLATFWSYITEHSLNSSTQTLEITLWKPKVDCYSLSVVSLISLTSTLLSFPPLQDSWTPPNVWLWIFASASISCWMMTLLWHLDYEPIWSQEIASSGYLSTVPMSLSCGPTIDSSEIYLNQASAWPQNVPTHSNSAALSQLTKYLLFPLLREI